MESALEVEDFFLLLGTLLSERRAAVRGRGRICFAVPGSGAWLLDLKTPGTLQRNFDASAETLVVCNQEGLARLATGELEEKAQSPNHDALLLWSGERRPLLDLARALGGARSIFETRVSAMRGAR